MIVKCEQAIMNGQYFTVGDFYLGYRGKNWIYDRPGYSWHNFFILSIIIYTMEKEKRLNTAANSKTMNAVENVKLFVAAGDTEPVINFRGTNQEARESGSSGREPVRKKQL